MATPERNGQGHSMPNLRIVALDLSLTCTGIAVSWRPHPWTFKPETSGLARLRDIREEILTTCIEADVVIIEGYAYARANQAHQLGELGGVVRLALYEEGFPIVNVPPPVLKKFATGAGNAKKEAVLAAAIRKLGYAGYDHNEADALWLLQAARGHYEGHVHSALAKVVWPTL